MDRATATKDGSPKYACRCGYPARSADDLFDHMVNADDDQKHGSK